MGAHDPRGGGAKETNCKEPVSSAIGEPRTPPTLPDARETLISIAHSPGHQHRHPSESVQYLIKWAPLHFTPLFTSEHRSQQPPPPHLTPRGLHNSLFCFFWCVFFIQASQLINAKHLTGKLLSKQILDKSPERCCVVVFGDFSYDSQRRAADSLQGCQTRGKRFCCRCCSCFLF